MSNRTTEASAANLDIGINIGKASKDDRGITVYTKNILTRLNRVLGGDRAVLLNYRNGAPIETYGINNHSSAVIPFSDKHGPWVTMFCEQILNPIFQKRSKLDVVWHPHNRSQFFNPVAYVATMHDIQAVARPDLVGGYLSSIGKKLLYRSRTFSATRSDHIIAVSEFTRQEIVKHLGVSPNKVTVVHCGIDLEVFKPAKIRAQKEVRLKYSLPAKYVLTTGSYAPHKNLKVLVQAYAQSSLPGSGVDLVMVGPNDATGYKLGYQQISEHVKSLGLTDRVVLLPSVPLKDLVVLYGGATMFAATSLYEGFGLTSLEAMACEVPVVVSCTTAFPEVCGDAALYADPDDPKSFARQFDKLLSSDSLRRRQIAKGNRRVTEYSWDETAKQTMHILQKVAKDRR